MVTLRSIRLGLAAGAVAVAVAVAQAADLPTHNAAPVEYARTCTVGGITGWVAPGSGICVKLSGYITAQFEGGNLATQYNWSSTANIPGIAGNPPAYLGATQRILVQASDSLNNSTFYRDGVGWTTDADFGFDVASNTAYGPLIGHMDVKVLMGNGFDTDGAQTVLNTGYLTWAGLTAGKAQSFYSFIDGGENWASFFSPDRKGFNQPPLLAYTAILHDGFSATVSFESPGPVRGDVGGAGGTDMTGAGGGNQGPIGGYDPGSISFGGQRWPDVVGALHIKQGWGEAQLSGVLHNVNVTAVDSRCGDLDLLDCNASENKVGWGIDAGAKLNLPSIGADDNFVVTSSYTRSAVWYSGLPDGMWGENGQVNGNGQPMVLADAFFNPLTQQWSAPTAWSLSALFEHHFTPQLYINPEASIGGIKWANRGGGCFGCGLGQYGGGAISPSALSWIIGADIGWNPINNLNFDLELMYQSTDQQKPSGFLGTIYSFGEPSQMFALGAWEGNSSGFAGRLRITRYF